MRNLRYNICALLLLIAHAHCRTVTHTETVTNPNGEKVTRTWTTTENNDMPMQSSFPKDVEFFNGNSVFSMQPAREIKRIGGTNINAESIQRDPTLAKGMDATALLELFRTKQPVTRITTDAAGHKRTTTYSLLPDGSVKSETVTDIPPSVLSTAGQTNWQIPSVQSRFNAEPATNSWTSFDDFVAERRHKPKEQSVTSTTTNIKLPETWDPSRWRTYDERAPTWWSSPTLDTEWQSSFATSTQKPRTTTTVSSQLPPLDEFLKREYGGTQASPRPTTTLKLEDFPITGIYKPGEPIDESLLHNLPTLNHTTAEDSFAVDTLPAAERTHVNTKVKTLTRTITSSSPPTAADLDPNMLDILSRAGIRPEDVHLSSDGTITKTRTEPDGRRITTTFKVNRLPQPTYTNLQPAYAGPAVVTTTTSTTRSPHNAVFINPIDNFLAKLGMSTDDILLENGVLVKKLTDADGRILTVNFTLSTVKHELEEQQRKANEAMIQSPIK